MDKVYACGLIDGWITEDEILKDCGQKYLDKVLEIKDELVKTL